MTKKAFLSIPTFGMIVAIQKKIENILCLLAHDVVTDHYNHDQFAKLIGDKGATFPIKADR